MENTWHYRLDHALTERGFFVVKKIRHSKLFC